MMDIWCFMTYLLSYNQTNQSLDYYEPSLLGYPGEEPEEFWDFDYDNPFYDNEIIQDYDYDYENELFMYKLNEI